MEDTLRSTTPGLWLANEQLRYKSTLTPGSTAVNAVVSMSHLDPKVPHYPAIRHSDCFDGSYSLKRDFIHIKFPRNNSISLVDFLKL